MRTETHKDWRFVELHELGRIVTGSTPPKARQEYYGGSFPFVKPGELRQCSVSDSVDRLSDAGSEVADIAPAGGVLVSCIGNLGKIGLATRPVAFNQQINAIIPHAPEHSKWVFYAVQTPDFVAQLAAASSATTIAIVNKGKFSALRIPLAPASKQRLIVAEIEKQFTRLDAGIAALRRTQANLKRYRAAVLKAACEGRLVAGNSTKWATTTVGESVMIIDYRGRTPPFSDSGIPHLRSQNIRHGRIVWHDLAYVTAKDFDDFMTRGLPELGDLLFTTEAPMGEIAVAPTEKFSVAQRIMILRANPKIFESRFLMVQLRSPQFQARLSKSGTGSTVTGVSSRNFQPMVLLVPPLAEQTRIVAEVERRLSVAEELETVVNTNLQRATRLRQSILQQAFSGNLLVTPINSRD